MKRFGLTRSTGRLVGASVLSMALFGCDAGSSLIITGQTAADVAAGTTAIGSAVSVAIDSDAAVAADPVVANPVVADPVPVVPAPVAPVNSTPIDNDASFGAVAATHIADRTALGPVKIMAVGDSITHGVVGASSYRQSFSTLMTAASCDFTMVGSQTTSLASGGDPDCEDTPPLNDGWGWNGAQSCLVGASADASDQFNGAHEGYSSHRADHFLTGHNSSAGNNAGISVSMQTYTPDVVLLHIGSVDMYNQQTVGSTLFDIENVLTTIYETKPDTLVLIANVIPWYSANPYTRIGEDIASLGDGIQEIVAERYDPLLKMVDVREGFTESMMMDDLIHPNAIGEAHIAQAFMDVYQPLANCQ